MKKLYFSVIALLTLTQAQAATYFVSPSGAGTNSGANWANAMTLAQAITAATNGDNIFVLKGTYISATSGSALISITGAKSGIKIYGGFQGSETTLAERSFGTTRADSTTFVGNNYRVITNAGTSGVPITSATVFDGLTITGGVLNAASTYGAGMYNVYASPTISNCIFSANENKMDNGGGLLNHTASSPSISNCIFIGNKTSGYGGGVWFHTSSTGTVSNCTFTKNTASIGAGIYTTGITSLTLTNCTITDNTVSNRGAGIYINTGAGFSATGCTITNNTATNNGGGIYIDSSTNSSMTNCTISNNTASGAAGIYITSSPTPSITSCTVSNNNAISGNAGGIYSASSATTITGGIVSGNTATGRGGGIYCNNAVTINGTEISGNTTSADNGGGMFYNGGAATITNVKFINNTAATGNGGGAYYTGTTANTLTGCTFSGNTAANGGGFYNDAGRPILAACIISGNTATLGGGMFHYNALAAAKTVNTLITGNKATTNGGGVYNSDATCVPAFVNCTIAGNNAVTDGGGVYNTGTAATKPVITNCIIYGNSNGIVNVSLATATVTYSNVQYTSGNETDYSAGTGNNKLDPMLTNIPAYSGAPFTTGDYTLGSNSASAVDKGLNSAISGYTTDITGISDRIYNGVTVDMGAYEYQGVLPVTIASFTASYQKQSGQVQLNWTTASEQNNARFDIYRAAADKDFKLIGSKNGSGTTNVVTNYNFTDRSPLAGLNYYQLVQIDADGKATSFDKTLAVKTGLADNAILVSSSDQSVTVFLNGIIAVNANVAISDMAGRNLFKQTISADGNSVNLPVALSKGVYVLVLNTQNGNYAVKFSR